MQQVTIQYYGMDGTGRTVTEAKRDAGTKIERALTGHYTPAFIRAGDLLGFIWREPGGYYYKIIRPDSEAGSAYGCGMAQGSTERETVHACARHMADNLGSYAGLEKYLDRAQIRDLDQRFAFVAEYRKHIASGMSDTEAHAAAAGRP